MKPSDRSALREASEWFARMRGPEAATCHEAFERWLAASDVNRKAFNRVAETFTLGKHLAERLSRRSEIKGATRRVFLVPAVAAAAIGLVGLSFLSLRHVTNLPGSAAQNPQHFKTRIGEIRVMRLADGSQITLDTGTVLAVDISDTRRDIEMTRGRARFDVAHDAQAS